MKERKIEREDEIKRVNQMWKGEERKKKKNETERERERERESKDGG